MKNMPRQREILAFWLEQDEFPNLCFDEPACFACGVERGALERAHLIPRSEGGRADASNVVLLCARCHREAPMIGFSARPMIDWINRRESHLDYTWRRIREECDAIDPSLFGRLNTLMSMDERLSLRSQSKDFTARVRAMSKYLRAGIHIGGDCAATVAAILAAMADLAIASRDSSQETPPDVSG